MAKRRNNESGIELEPRLEVRCLRCRRPRDLEGRAIVRHRATIVARSSTPCECGEHRIRVRFSLKA